MAAAGLNSPRQRRRHSSGSMAAAGRASSIITAPSHNHLKQNKIISELSLDGIFCLLGLFLNEGIYENCKIDLLGQLSVKH